MFSRILAWLFPSKRAAGATTAFEPAAAMAAPASPLPPTPAAAVNAGAAEGPHAIVEQASTQQTVVLEVAQAAHEDHAHGVSDPPSDAGVHAMPEDWVAPAAVVRLSVDASMAGLTATLRHRIDALLSDLVNGDSRMLLENVAAEPTATIRQLPAAAQRALALTQRAEPPMTELTEVFEEDPTLAQALLTQANSGMYGGGRPVLSVRDALQRLGVSAARNVLMGHTVSALLCRPGGKYATMVDDVWQHMVRTAPIARRIASAFNADPEEAFGLGLLHDVGKLVIFDRLTTLRIELRREVVIPAADLSAILRALHEPLGGLAVHNWQLGPAAAAAVASHHRDPVPALRDALSEVLCVAEAADIASIRGEEFDLALTWDRAVLGGSAIRVERALMAA